VPRQQPYTGGVARINIDGAIADALEDRGHHPHPHAKFVHLKTEALLGTYPMLEAWRQRF
jgi:hypothetical protein